MKENQDITQLTHDLTHDMKDIGISSFILDHLQPATGYKGKPPYVYDLKALAKIENVIIQQMGWLEHTSDWDPYLCIELQDGTVFDSMNGYSSFEVSKDDHSIIIEAPEPGEWDDIDKKEYQRFYTQIGEQCYWVIKIQDIKSIQIQR